MCGGSDPFQAVGDAFASIDPGPAIGSGLAELDKGVNDTIPGGWYTLGGLAAGGAGLYFAPEILAAMGAEAGTAITSEAGQQAFFNALANGAASTDAISAGLAAETAAGIGTGAGASAELMGPTYGELGVTGVPEGGMGPTYADMGYTGLNQQAAIDAANAAANAASGGLTGNDILNGLSKANQIKNLATSGYNLLNGPSGATVKTGLGMLSGAGATAAGAGGTGSGSGYTEPMVNLTPGLTNSNQNYSLTGMPTVSQNVMHAASGGSAKSSLFDDKGNYNYNNSDDTPMTAALTKAKLDYQLTGLPVLNKAEGGSIHNPEFYSEGGASMANRYVEGDGDGTSDSIPAMLANGEFVVPADVVSGLGNGSNDAGAKVLDEFLSTIREHKRKNKTDKLPPNSKEALSYLTDAKRKIKA